MLSEHQIKRLRMAIAAELVLCLIALAGIWCDGGFGGTGSGFFKNNGNTNAMEGQDNTAGKEDWVREAVSEGYIKWVDFNVSHTALNAAYELDIQTYGKDVHLDWVELLAYLGARYGGNFDAHEKTVVKDLENLADKLTKEGRTMEELTADMEYYSYYEEAYRAVLGGMVGEYKVRVNKGQEDMEQMVEETRYGLIAYSPIARDFYYEHYDDFGTSRSYGYKRQHLGHDMMGQIGTPIIAIESGYVEALGWNQYGGWRIGIRSFDKKRYYYYAHLRQNYPYAQGLEEGSVVTAGDVIGYMGHTGYSTKENVNNIEITHLHWGMQLIFDESQKEGNNEIWIDVYPLTQFLYKNRSSVEKVEGSKEWRRVEEIRIPSLETFYTGDHTESDVSANEIN